MSKVSDLSSKFILIIYWLTTQLGPFATLFKVENCTPPDLQMDLLPSHQSHSICQHYNQPNGLFFFFFFCILKELCLYASGKSSYNPKDMHTPI